MRPEPEPSDSEPEEELIMENKVQPIFLKPNQEVPPPKVLEPKFLPKNEEVPLPEKLKKFETTPPPVSKPMKDPMIEEAKQEPKPKLSLLLKAVNTPLPDDEPITPAADIKPLPEQDRFGQYQADPKFVTIQPESSALMADSSAVGVVRRYDEIAPDEYLNECGSFLTRERANPVSSAPYPTNDCLLRAVSKATGIETETLWATLIHQLPESQVSNAEIRESGLSTDHFAVLAHNFSLAAKFISEGVSFDSGVRGARHNFTIKHTPEDKKKGIQGHFELAPDNTMVPQTKLNGASTLDLDKVLCAFRVQDKLLPFRKIHKYKTTVARAKNLISNMKNGFDGVMGNVDPLHPTRARDSFVSLDQRIDVATPKTVSLIHIAGFAGCGKSYPVQQLLRHPAFAHYKVSVPTVELRSEWKEGLNLNKSSVWRVGTWESSLLKSARILVIDEVYKMPRGYLDLAIHADPCVQFVIVLGDPLQGAYHSTNPSSTNHRISPENLHLKPYLDCYCLWSRRIPKLIAQFFRINTLSEQQGFVSYRAALPQNTTILVNSYNTAMTLKDCGHKAVTVASSQGATYRHPVCINLDRHSSQLSPEHSIVALTRSTVGIIFSGDQSIIQGGPTSNLMFSQLSSWSRKSGAEPFDLPAFYADHLRGVEIISEPMTRRSQSLRGASQLQQQVISESQVVQECSEGGKPVHNSSARKPASAIYHPELSVMNSEFVGDIVIRAGITIGSGDSNAPQVSTHFLPETRRPLHQDIPSAMHSETASSKSVFTAPSVEPVYPGEDFYNVAKFFMPAHDPEIKEILWKDQVSNQFPYLNLPFSLSAQPSSLIAAKHHSQQDPTLLPASIEKRLRFRVNSSPYQITAKDVLLGRALYESWCRAYHRNPMHVEEFMPELFAECININEYAQLTSKTQATIMANQTRSDPDWRWSAVRIFSKNQHKTNEASIFGNWKACQTLALMHDAAILLLGPVKKYQRCFDKAEKPDNIYIHASHTPFDLSAWCQEHLTETEHIANDYTAFDQSQHGEAVVFELLKMLRVSIPDQLIELHHFLKTNVETQFGPLTCMRLTGEPGTYDDNTDYNLAVMFLEYLITDQAVLVSGDDSLIDSLPPTNPSWATFGPLLALRFKKEKSRYSLFCGYYVGKAGACRSPITLFAKLMMAVDDHSLGDKLPSYLTEFSVGHSLGQDMWNLLPIEQVQYQSANFDFFCRHASSEQKIALKIGEVPEDIVSKVLSGVKWVTRPLYALLDSAARSAIKKLKHSPRLIEDPEVSQLEGQLLENFQLNNPTSARMNARLVGGSASSAKPLETSAVPSTTITPSGSTSRDAGMDKKNMSNLVPGHSSDAHVVIPPTVATPSRALTSPAFGDTPSLNIPFQFKWFDIDGSSSSLTSKDIISATPVATIYAPFRHVTLSSLEVMVTTLHPAMTYPQTLDLLWTPANLSISGDQLMSTFGSTRLVLGGPINLPAHSLYPCPLGSINPILRDSVTYNDTPRIHAQQHVSEDSKAKKLVCGSVYIRGTLSVRNPGIIPTS